MRKNAFYKDIRRTLKNNLARFIAITVMASLGIGVFAGFAVGCLDVLRSADDFYNEQNNYDIQVVSTLGLTNDDLAALSGADGVSATFGNISMDVKAKLTGGELALANLTTLDAKGMNKPYVLEGILPVQSGQIAVNSKFIDDTGLHIGDIITLTQADTGGNISALAVNEYKITAIVQNPLDISNAKSGIAYVSFSNSSKYTIYTTSDGIKSDIYSAIYLTVDGAAKLDSYSEEYRQLVTKTSSAIQDTIQEKRQQERYDEVVEDAKAQISDGAKLPADKMEIAMTKWYVWDRSDNESFTGLKSDMDFIQAVTKAFPIIFFLVAVLICLTTMTRMVEEDRGLIGTYKSLGYSNYRISLKYLLYALLSCIIGGGLGGVIGFIGLPMVIESIFSSMYVLPLFQLHFYPFYAFAGFGLFLLGIAGATIISCAAMLRQRPAKLMRPKAPRAGSRIFLERFPSVWKRLNFLRKLTCRNLFRYKKRASMTIVGILGCTMLIVLGFGLRDTVGGLMSDQFDTVAVYDAIIVTDNLNKDEMNRLENEWISAGKVNDALHLQLSSMTLRSKSDHTDMTVMVIPDDADLSSYIHLRDSATDKAMPLPSNGIVVTKNAAKQLDLTNGDMVSLLNEDNLQHDFSVAFVAENYAGNYVFVSESVYQAAFGNYAGTSFLLNLTGKTAGQEWLASLHDNDRILNVSSSQTAIDVFNEINIDMVIYLLIGMSAVLALAVLFTLSNINISERERELATIKVLGFQRKEVYSYVNKETVILSVIGILCGLPAGYGITYGIMGTLSIADISFKVRVSPVAYLIAAVLTLVFTLLVNKITNKGLRKINMVEALKSVE